VVRLLFQPAEEASYLGGGAKPMIEEGCLIGVDEVYGLHNYPFAPVGTVRVIAGPMMAESSNIEITFTGKGGHASAPENANDPLQRAIDFHIKLRELSDIYKKKGAKFVCTMPVLHVGEVGNVIPEKCYLKGTFRSFENKFTQEFKQKIQEILNEISEKTDCQTEFKLITRYPVVDNSKEHAEIVERVAKQVYGESNVSSKDLPSAVAEDFAYFLQETPGSFFFIGTWDKEKLPKPYMLHDLHYNFNDDVIEQTSEMWFRLMADRFDLKL